MIKMSASIMCANQLYMIRDVQALIKEHIDMFHFDVIDGDFIENFALNLEIIKDLRKLTNIPFDAHLMVRKPSKYFKKIIDYGVDIICFHVECDENIKENIELVKELGGSPGLAIHAETPISELLPYLKLVDFVLHMNVKTGYSRGEFIDESYNRIAELHCNINDNGLKTQIISDGGTAISRIDRLYQMGADIIIGGTSSLFNNRGFSKNLSDLRTIDYSAIKRTTEIPENNKTGNSYKAAVLHDIKDIEVIDVTERKLKNHEVLVDVAFCGICGSDFERLYSKGMYEKDLIPGHEFSGIVSKVKPGDEELLNKRVGVFPLIPCKTCRYCKSGNYNLCENYNYLGSRTHGGFAEKVIVPKENLFVLPRSVSLEEASQIEPLAVCYHGLSKLGNLTDRSVLVLGLGTIGVIAGQLSNYLGAKEVLGVDRNEYKHKIANEVGFSQCFLGEDQIDHEIDLIIDCAGVSSLLEIGISSLKKKGRVLILANYKNAFSISGSNMSRIMRGEITFTTSWNSNILDPHENDWRVCINLLRDRKINLFPLLTHKYNLCDIREAFDRARDKKDESLKTLIQMERT